MSKVKSVKSGGTWQFAHFALPSKSASPRRSGPVSLTRPVFQASYFELKALTSTEASYAAIDSPIKSYARSGSAQTSSPPTFMKSEAYELVHTLLTTAAALGLFCSSGLRNGPSAWSAAGLPRCSPVARPSQKFPPLKRPALGSYVRTVANGA